MQRKTATREFRKETDKDQIIGQVIINLTDDSSSGSKKEDESK
jgi:hypothetical protein